MSIWYLFQMPHLRVQIIRALTSDGCFVALGVQSLLADGVAETNRDFVAILVGRAGFQGRDARAAPVEPRFQTLEVERNPFLETDFG